MNLEMDFTKGLSLKGTVRFAVARDDTHGFIADDLGSLLGFRVDDDLIGTVNFVVRENTVLEHEPPWPPSFTVVHPLMQYPRDSVPDEVVDPNVHRR